jgi:hypothetical protein
VWKKVYFTRIFRQIKDISRKNTLCGQNAEFWYAKAGGSIGLQKVELFRWRPFEGRYQFQKMKMPYGNKSEEYGGCCDDGIICFSQNIFTGGPLTERDGVADRLSMYIRVMLASNLGRDTRCPQWGFHGSPQSLQANVGIVPPFFHYRFLPNPFQFTIQLSSYHSILRVYGLWYCEHRKIIHQNICRLMKCYFCNRQRSEKFIFWSKSYDPQTLSLCADSALDRHMHVEAAIYFVNFWKQKIVAVQLYVCMYTYVCMVCMCMYVCMCTVCICRCVCTCVWCACVGRYVYTYVYGVHVCACMYVCVYGVHLYACVYGVKV